MTNPLRGLLLKDAMAGLTNTISLKAPPKESAISRLKIKEYDSPIDTTKPVDLDQIAERVIRKFSKGELPERRDLQHASFCLWETVPTLLDNPAALDGYLQWIATLRRKSDFRRLAEAYVRCFNFRARDIQKIALTLSQNAPNVGGRWSERSKEYRIFDPQEGPRAVANLALAQEIDPVHFLRDRNQWSESLAIAGFAQAVWLEGLIEIDRSSQSESERFARLVQWNGPHKNEMLFPPLKASFVDAMVMPYEVGGPSDKSLRDSMMNFLLGTVGDPRLSPQKWVGLDNAASVMNRWLVEQSFRQFLDIVEKISSNEQQWDYRRAFWEGVYKKCQGKKIEVRAWVVFSHKGAKAARESFGSNVSFGVFRDNSPELKDTHAVFMLEIGDYLFVDWNESGPCNIWRKKVTTNRPKLYEHYYRRNDLRHKPPDVRTDENLIPLGIFDHRGSSNYVWQKRIADEIVDARGPRLWQADYRLL